MEEQGGNISCVNREAGEIIPCINGKAVEFSHIKWITVSMEKNKQQENAADIFQCTKEKLQK